MSSGFLAELRRPAGPLAGSLLALVVGYLPLRLLPINLPVTIDGVVAAVLFAVTWVLVAIIGAHAPDRPTGQAIAAVNDGAGTVMVSAVLLLSSLAMLTIGLLTRSLVPYALAFTVAAATCLAAGGRRAVDAPPLDPDGEIPPGDPAKFQRVELPWALPDVDPALEGAAGCWVSTETLSAFRARNPQTRWLADPAGWPDLLWYVHEGRCAEVDALVRSLSRQARDFGLDPVLECRMVLDFVQRIPYVEDEDSKGVDDYWRFPLETVADGCGDCEDSSILMAALLSGLGYQVCLFHFPNHAAIGIAGLPETVGAPVVRDGVQYQFAETTTTGITLGEWPDGLSPAAAPIVGVVEPFQAHLEAQDLREDAVGAWGQAGRVLVAGSIAVIVGSAALGVLAAR